MSLLSFRVENQKSLVLAEATAVPPVMVIAGPNGVGKSTLLYAIKSGSGVLSGNTRLLYQGPHRVLRRTQIQRRWLGGGIRWMLDALTGGDVSGYEGLSFQNPSRSPDNVDEVGSTLKHTLGKIENRRQAVIAELYDVRRAKGVPLETSEDSDVYEPLRKLTEYLLPHLTFLKIDFKNEDNVRCLWTRTDSSKQLELDIDDLSSGEKSIVVLFLPLLEDQIRERLQALEILANPDATPTPPVEDRVVLIDEPEQHLHPDLQAKILTYIRNVSHEATIQFILTTHSPTILDQASDEELFVLVSPSKEPGENQLRRIATNAERLEALKELAGSTYFLTTGRVIVCIEGEQATESSKPGEATDAHLLEIMYPRATAVTLVPTTGKGNVIATVSRLREHVPEATYRIRVRGLVDADQSTTDVEGIERLPVCMIENFLLDPEAIHAYAKKQGIANFPDTEAVRAELTSIANEERDEEIRLRVQRRFKGFTVRIGGASVEQVKAQHAAMRSRLEALLPSDDEIARYVSEVSAEVDRTIAEGSTFDRFRGKEVLKQFHRRHVAVKNVSYAAMCIDLAKLVAEGKKVEPRLDPVFNRLLSD